MLNYLITFSSVLAILISKSCAINNPHQSWTLLNQSKVDQFETHTFTIALQHRNIQYLEQKLYSISNPQSQSYGKFLTSQEIKSIVSPDQTTIEYILHWLYNDSSSQSCQMTHELTTHGDYIKVTTCLKRISALFQNKITFSQYQHPRFPKTKILRSRELFHFKSNMEKLGVPQDISDQIYSIYNISELPQVMRSSSLRSHILQSQPGETITPPILDNYYNIPSQIEGLSSSTSSGQNKQAVAEFQEAYYYESDIQNFQANFTHHTIPIAKIIGINTPDQGYLGQATLDLEYMTTLSPLQTWVWSQYEFDLAMWAQNVTGTQNAPLVHSISWGSEESSYSDDKMQRDNIEFMKMGLQGFTVLIASGDDGTGSSGWFSCGKFDPTFPASSPYVTAVGGTYLQDGEEIAWKYSGGGFSNVFSRPSYQDDAVREYLTNAKDHLPNQKLFNATGRATPDVSAFATNYSTVIQKFWGQMSGTSAASPVFASLISMINSKRLKNGKGPLGFVNPLLYKLKKGVGNDIVNGMNQSSSCSKGFKAIEGWDPATGLGSPNFQILVEQMVEVGIKDIKIE